VLASSVPRDAVDGAVTVSGRAAKRSDEKLPPHVVVYFAGVQGGPCKQADGRHVIDSALRATLMIQAKDTESDQAPHGGYRAARRSDGSIKAEA
jgi:hypothetical protein